MTRVGNPDVKGSGKMAKKKTAKKKERLPFHYIKANQFRVIHADGVHGGITPRGYIQMALFSDRHPIPQIVVHEIDQDGKVSPKELASERVSKPGIVREVETEVIMDLDAAKVISKWLANKISMVEKLRKQAIAEAKKKK